MKKKVLTLLGALAALGLAACQTPTEPASSAPASTPASSQPAASSKPAESSKPASSKPASSSQPAVETDPFKKATGHSVKNYQDVPGDTEKGTAAYKMGLCDDNDGFSAIRVNQSAVTYPSGSKRKNGTPEGYTKLDGDGQKMTFKIEVAKGYTGKLYLFGVMDNWSRNTGSSFFYNGAPNTKIEVNGVSIDCSAQNGKTYLDYFGDGQGEGTLSPEGYAEFGSCTLKPGVNEIVYTRVATLNMLVKDFVFVGEEAQEWSAPVEVAADATAGTVAYKKYTNNFDGSVKIEFNAMDGSLVGTSALKTDGPAGYMKLGSDGEKQISYKFNFNANLDGKFYQHGMMDGYTDRDGNKERTYYSGSSHDSVPNFKFLVNGVDVYVGEQRTTKYRDFFGDTEVEINSKKYSEVKDCEIGEAFLKNGENNITFQRVNSYNLLVDKFVFIGKAGNAHTAPEATAEWHMDDISHWQEAENDSFKWNRADNEWERDPEHDVISTACNVDDQLAYKEKTTGATKMVPGPSSAEHTWEAGNKVADVTPSSCSACHKTMYSMLKADADGDNDTTKKLGKNTDVYSTYDITGAIPAGTYDVELLGKITNGIGGQDIKKKYAIYLGEIVDANKIELDSVTYDTLGWDTATDKWGSKKVLTITIPENATSLSIKNIESGNTCYINGMRLVSTAVAAE